MASSSLLSSDVDVRRKRKVVSIEKKLEICCRHKMKQSYTSLSKEYNLGESTIHDIIQSEDRLTEYALEIQHASAKRSIIRRSKYEELDKALHLWFYRSEHCLWAYFNSKSQNFILEIVWQQQYSITDASDTSKKRPVQNGWQMAKFKARYGIRKLCCEGESLSTNSNDIEPFKIRLANVTEEEHYTRHRLFNCDETGLNWKMLQDTTLADGSEKFPRGFKASKE